MQSGSAELGELLLSLRYLPTAGRLTVTVLKARHLRATDVTGKTGEQSWKTGAVKSTKASTVDLSSRMNTSWHSPGIQRGALG